MHFVHRLRIASVLLGIAAVIVCTQLLGDAPGKKPVADPRSGGGLQGAADKARLGEADSTRFSNMPVLTYQTRNNDNLFALQVQANLEAAEAKPLDILVMIDTSASQAGLPLKRARQILTALMDNLSPVDRMAVWTVNTPKATRDLTRGFFNTNAPVLASARKYLAETEYASGASDLKGSIRKALPTFEQRGSRRQVILYVGDGEASYDPLSVGDRLELAEEIVKSNAVFYTLPVGIKMNPENIHGLAAFTGGTVVRAEGVDNNDPREQIVMANKLLSAFHTAILYPTSFTLEGNIHESFPSKLPPLRSNTPTLVVGKFATLPQEIKATIKGKVEGNERTITISEKVPASSADHYFLVSVVEQWRKAGSKNSPAVLRADRSLALAYEQCRLVREELLTQAHLAIRDHRLDAAASLYDAAGNLDPYDAEAKAGRNVVNRMLAGKLTRAELIRQAKAAIGKAGETLTVEEEDRLVRLALAQEPAAPPAPADGGMKPLNDDSALKIAQARQNAIEQQVRLEVDEKLRLYRKLLETDPVGANGQLKLLLSSVDDNINITPALKQTLRTRIISLQQEIATRGAIILQKQKEETERIERAKARLDIEEKRQIAEEKIRERIRAFATLMNQARYEDAYTEALQLQRDQVNRGEKVPVEATASYAISTNATNIRENRELVRLREERFLLTMMQVEKSHIPYPDEPPVHFPPAVVWRELTKYRTSKYSQFGLGGDPQETARNLDLYRRLRETIYEEREDKDGTLSEIMENVFKDRYKVEYYIDKAAFKEKDASLNIDTETVKVPKSSGVSLEAALRKMLDSLPQNFGATYMIRDGRVEVTTGDRVFASKAIRAFPVADLVIPIPSAVNQATLQQNLQVQGGNAQTSAFGANLLGQFLGGFNPNINLNGGQPGGQFMGNFQGQQQGFQGGCQNSGFGGGANGFGGGQQGQFGNLGGQFGIQGGDQSQQLMDLIRTVVDPGYWGTGFGCTTGNQGNGGPDATNEPAPLESNPNLQNQLFYYAPARALIIRGTSRIYGPSGYSKLKIAGGAGPVVGLPNVPRPGQLVQNQPGKDDPIDVNPKKMWEKFLAKSDIAPGMVIAAADVLMDSMNFDHTAELLKASLRNGVLVQPLVHDALVLALQSSQAAPEEIERAQLAAIDHNPTDPQAYLKAAKALGDANQPEEAVKMCRTAARLNPELVDPYLSALAYANQAKTTDVDTIGWAAGNVLRRDWARIGTTDYHAQVREYLHQAEAKLIAAGRSTEIAKLKQNLDTEHRRDLIVELLWSGRADLDLKVTEPCGSTCSNVQKYSVGGGILHGDLFEQTDKDRSETYTASEAFPGTYKLTVNHIFGRPLDNKARLRITRNAGSPNQTQEIITVELSANNSVEITLAEGRRKELAGLPPIATTPIVEAPATRSNARLSSTMTSVRGGVGSVAGIATKPIEESNSLVKVGYEGRIASSVIRGMDLRAKTELLPDGRRVRVEMSPVFTGLLGAKDLSIRIPMLPGGEE